MLSLYLRFLFKFSFIISNVFAFLIADNSSSTNRTYCQTNWHYLSEKTSCILFARSELGDVRWYDGYKACQTNSAELLKISNSNEMKSIEKKIQNYTDHIRRGTWIGTANWTNQDLCDHDDDNQYDCMILTRRLNSSSLCLKKVSCQEDHPFICENSPMTEQEFIENTMERVTWWKCIINVIWCAVDNSDEKAAQQKKDEEAKAAEKQNYINQFDFNTPPGAAPSGDQITVKPLIAPEPESENWLVMIGGGCLTLLVLSSCCAACIYAYKRFKNRNNLRKESDSSDSIYSDS